MAGLEVEERHPAGRSAWTAWWWPKSSAREKHPEADRLQVCKVDAGQGELLQIVCGAPNARVGIKVPLAMVGATLAGGINIKAAKLRGVESFGMLCSAKELGIDADASGLLELPADAPVGKPLAEYLGLPDASIELKLTPNRRRLPQRSTASRSTSRPLFGSHVKAGRAAGRASSPATARRGIRLDAGADAPRYLGRVIEGVDASGTHAAVDGRAPASRGRASDQRRRRRHPVRDARTRPADACVRQRHAAGRRSSCAMRATAKRSSCSTVAKPSSTRVSC